MAWAIGIVTGVISGILASAIFFAISYCIRPKIIIGQNISHTKENGKDIYIIKVINHSYYEYVDVSYLLQLYSPDGEYNTKTELIKPLKDIAPTIDAYASEKKKPRCEYATRISYDISDIVDSLGKKMGNPRDDNGVNRLVFTIQGKHGLSSSRAVFTQIFYKDNIVDGNFETGVSTKINP